MLDVTSRPMAGRGLSSPLRIAAAGPGAFPSARGLASPGEDVSILNPV